MEGFDFEDLDAHIASLQSQLTFLASALHATDHTTPEWMSTDIIALRNVTGRLRDDMGVFQAKLDGEGVRTRKDGRKRARLSIENAGVDPDPAPLHSAEPKSKPVNRDDAQPPYPNLPTSSSPPPPQPGSGPANTAPTFEALGREDGGAYTPQFLDVSSLVEQRLQERRLKSLMDSPRTAQKRKRLHFGEQDNVPGLEDEGEQIPGEGQSSRGGSPVKRVKAFGTFEGVLKRKDGGLDDTDVGIGESDGREADGSGAGKGRKRQRL